MLPRTEVLMSRRFEFGPILLIAALATLPLCAHADDDEQAALTRPIAYVVCGDTFFDDVSAYRIDVLAGSVLNISEPIEWAGAPELLVFDSNQSRLIIGSWSKPERAGGEPDRYVWPVTVLRVGGGEFRVVNRFAINRENYTSYPANPKKGPPQLPQEVVYRLALSPDGHSLYLGHSELGRRGDELKNPSFTLTTGLAGLRRMTAIRAGKSPASASTK